MAKAEKGTGPKACEHGNHPNTCGELPCSTHNRGAGSRVPAGKKAEHTETERRILRTIASMPGGAAERFHKIQRAHGFGGLRVGSGVTPVTLDYVADYLEEIRAMVGEVFERERERENLLRETLRDVEGVRRIFGTLRPEGD